MTKRVLAGAPFLVLGLIGAGCVQPNPPTAYTTEDVFGMAKPTYASGRQVEGHVVRLNPMAQMITISAGHGGEEATFPVESQGVAALRTLRPGTTVILTCRAIDSPSLRARADSRHVASAEVAVPTSSALAPAAGPIGGGALAGMHGLSAACPSVVRIETK